ncbi:MAG: 4-hydroxybenzoate octaprenyltransferase [Halothiobacillaceae bacterium]
MSTALRERLGHYVALTRLDRPVGILLLLWPTLWALWLAGNGQPQTTVLLIFVAGVILMRSAGCAINDYADRHIDGHVRRTRNRPLATGAIRPAEALGVFAALSLLALLLVLQLNRLTILLAGVAVLLAASYPFMKRFHHLPQLHLGIAFGWAIPMAWAAETGQLAPTAWLLFVANVFWTIAYDTLYAMADREDDLKIGVKSTAVLLGRHDLLAVGSLHGATLITLVVVGLVEGLSLLYYLGLGAAAVAAALQMHWVRNRDPAQCLRAFRANNVLGFIVLLAMIAGLGP